MEVMAWQQESCHCLQPVHLDLHQLHWPRCQRQRTLALWAKAPLVRRRLLLLRVQPPVGASEAKVKAEVKVEVKVEVGVGVGVE